MGSREALIEIVVLVTLREGVKAPRRVNMDHSGGTHIERFKIDTPEHQTHKLTAYMKL